MPSDLNLQWQTTQVRLLQEIDKGLDEKWSCEDIEHLAAAYALVSGRVSIYGGNVDRAAIEDIVQKPTS